MEFNGERKACALKIYLQTMETFSSNKQKEEKMQIVSLPISCNHNIVSSIICTNNKNN